MWKSELGTKHVFTTKPHSTTTELRVRVCVQHSLKLFEGLKADFTTDDFSIFEDENRWDSGNPILDG